MDRNEISAASVLKSLIEGILDSGTMLVLDGSFYEQIVDLVDSDSTDPKSPETLLKEAFDPDRKKLLDFGCGTAGHRSMIEGFGYQWRGVNYKAGMASQARDIASQDSYIDFYDGLILPYENESFDVVYSYQTFEHIQDIGVTFSEIARVLKPGGRLIGAVSYLEQIHDYSTYNFTPYGLKLAASASGMSLAKIYPSYDVFTWMLRRLLIVTSGSDENSLTESLSRNGFVQSSLNDYALRQEVSVQRVNLFRLMFSSHISFVIYKT